MTITGFVHAQVAVRENLSKSGAPPRPLLNIGHYRGRKLSATAGNLAQSLIPKATEQKVEPEVPIKKGNVLRLAGKFGAVVTRLLSPSGVVSVVVDLKPQAKSSLPPLQPAPTAEIIAPPVQKQVRFSEVVDVIPDVPMTEPEAAAEMPVKVEAQSFKKTGKKPRRAKPGEWTTDMAMAKTMERDRIRDERMRQAEIFAAGRTDH